MPNRPPNVLLILTDDQGWDDLGCHGNPYVRTPHLDALAAQSVQLANFYVAAVCAPTRASLLTGRHFLRTGVSHVHGGKDFVHPDEVTLGQHFQRAGYRTGMWGKWHSGKTTGYFPWQRGFDEAYMARLYKHHDSVGQLNGQPVSHEGWTIETLADYALDFIERHCDVPWFAFVSHLAPHAPLSAPQDRVARYEAMGLSRALATLYAMVEQVDASVGRVLAGLDAMGLAEDTIVLFLSDNGPAILEDQLTDADRRTRYVNGYKGHKGNMWENGIHVPLFVRWPGRYRPATVTRLADVCDLLPTLLDACGIALPADGPALDGRSITSYLEGDEASLGPKESCIWVHPGWPPDPRRPYDVNGLPGEYHPVSADEKAQLPFDPQLLGLRTEDYKLLRHPGYVQGQPDLLDGRLLVHIAEDPREDRNLAADQPGRVLAMEERLRLWFEGVRAEPHAFHSPHFVLGEGATDVVLAYAPCRVHGSIRNGGISSNQWTRPGDGADYHLDVRQAGPWRVHAQCRQLPTGSATLRLRAGVSELSATLTDTDQPLGTLDLPAGESTLHVELLDGALDGLQSLQFEPI